jgi:hypothetical protein
MENKKYLLQRASTMVWKTIGVYNTLEEVFNKLQEEGYEITEEEFYSNDLYDILSDMELNLEEFTQD